MPLAVPHPAGAAGGKEGKGLRAFVGQPFQKLCRLLHDRKVCGEVGVKDVVRADRSKDCGKAPDRCPLRLHAKGLSPARTDRGRDLEHRRDFRVVDCPEDLCRVIPLGERTHGTVGDALAAEGAVGLLQGVDLCHIHARLGTSVDDIPDPGLLHLLADLHAAHALDALLVVPDQREVGRRLLLWQVLRIGVVQDVQIPCDVLQAAAAAPHAGRAGGVVLREDELHVGPSCLQRPCGVRVNHHALVHRIVAGGEQPLISLHLDDADPAGADLI